MALLSQHSHWFDMWLFVAFDTLFFLFYVYIYIILKYLWYIAYIGIYYIYCIYIYIYIYICYTYIGYISRISSVINLHCRGFTEIRDGNSCFLWNQVGSIGVVPEWSLKPSSEKRFVSQQFATRLFWNVAGEKLQQCEHVVEAQLMSLQGVARSRQRLNM